MNSSLDLAKLKRYRPMTSIWVWYSRMAWRLVTTSPGVRMSEAHCLPLSGKPSGGWRHDPVPAPWTNRPLAKMIRREHPGFEVWMFLTQPGQGLLNEKVVALWSGCSSCPGVVPTTSGRKSAISRSISLVEISGIDGVRGNDFEGRGTVFLGKMRLVRLSAGVRVRKKGRQPAVRKPLRKLTSPFFSPNLVSAISASPRRSSPYFAVIFGSGMGDVILLFHPFRKPLSAGHKDNPHPAASLENTLNQPCCAQAFIVRVWREDHQTCARGDQRGQRQRFRCLGMSGGTIMAKITSTTRRPYHDDLRERPGPKA